MAYRRHRSLFPINSSSHPLPSLLDGACLLFPPIIPSRIVGELSARGQSDFETDSWWHDQYFGDAFMHLLSCLATSADIELNMIRAKIQ